MHIGPNSIKKKKMKLAERLSKKKIEFLSQDSQNNNNNNNNINNK